MKETLRHHEAFEYYYGMGAERSYDAVATKFGISKSTIFNWAKAHDWQERIEQRDIENARKLAKKTDDSIVNSKARYRKLIKVLIAKAVGKINRDELAAMSIKDIKMLINTDMLLMGEATERSETKEYVAVWGGSENDDSDSDGDDTRED